MEQSNHELTAEQRKQLQLEYDRALSALKKKIKHLSKSDLIRLVFDQANRAKIQQDINKVLLEENKALKGENDAKVSE